MSETEKLPIEYKSKMYDIANTYTEYHHKIKTRSSIKDMYNTIAVYNALKYYLDNFSDTEFYLKPLYFPLFPEDNCLREEMIEEAILEMPKDERAEFLVTLEEEMLDFLEE